VEMKADKTATD